jgi:hypothetical protein
MTAPKEWLRVSHTPTGSTVTCTLLDGNLSVRWTVKCYTHTIRECVIEARAGAIKALADLRAMTEETDG